MLADQGRHLGVDEDESEDLVIRLDRLTPEPWSSPNPNRHPFIQRLQYVVGTSDGAEWPPRSGNRKFRIFNAGFIVGVVAVLLGVVCLIVMIALLLGPRGVAQDWVLVALFLSLEVFFISSLTWGMSVVTRGDHILIRRHFRSTTARTDDVACADVKERVLSLKPVLEIDLQMKGGSTIRTPLGSGRTMAGRARLRETCSVLNAALNQRRAE